MDRAIGYLERQIETLKHRELVSRAEGRTDEADSALLDIADIEEAIRVIKANRPSPETPWA